MKKYNIFHIPYYSNLVQFASAEFHDENLKALGVNEEVIQTIDNKHIDKSKHCHRAGHLKIECFDLFPCLHCEKKTIT